MDPRMHQSVSRLKYINDRMTFIENCINFIWVTVLVYIFNVYMFRYIDADTFYAC